MKKLIFVFLGVALVLSGCSIRFGGEGDNPSKVPDGGVFKSTTSGTTWQNKSLIPTTSGKPGTMAGFGNTTFVIDPSDPKALYFAAAEGGVAVSYDGADTWREVPGLRTSVITNFAVDPKSKCVLYASTLNRLLKSDDCGRTWTQIYYDNDVTVTVSALAIDHYDSKIIYIGTERGEIIQSTDAGKSWQTLNRFENTIRKILLGPTDSRLIFVATESKGIFRSQDRGDSWSSLQDKLKDFKDNKRFRDLAVSPSQPGYVLLATKYGLIKSINNGDDWTALELITPESEATINSVITNPTTTEEIYYVTNTTFYSSVDGGQNWTTKKLPSSRPGHLIVSDPSEPKTLYLTFKPVKK